MPLKIKQIDITNLDISFDAQIDELLFTKLFQELLYQTLYLNQQISLPVTEIGSLIENMKMSESGVKKLRHGGLKTVSKFNEDIQKLSDFLSKFTFPSNIREGLIIIGGNIMYPYSFIHIIDIPCECHIDKPTTDSIRSACVRKLIREYITQSSSMFTKTFSIKPIHILLLGERNKIHPGFLPKPLFSIEKVNLRKSGKTIINMHCSNTESNGMNIREGCEDYVWYECVVKPKGFKDEV